MQQSSRYRRAEMILTRGIRDLLATGVFALSLASAPAQNAAPLAPVEIDIFDQSGASIPNAHIDLTEANTKVEQHFKADTHGTLLIQVPEGTYDLKTSSTGFLVRQQQLDVGSSNVLPVHVVLNVASGGSEITLGYDLDLLLEWPQVHTMIQLHCPMDLPAIKLPKHRKLFQHFNS